MFNDDKPFLDSLRDGGHDYNSLIYSSSYSPFKHVITLVLEI